MNRLEPLQSVYIKARAEASVHAGDCDLVAAVRQKDRKATAEFVSRYADVVVAYVRSRLTPRVEFVDDVVQEVFLAAWEDLDQYRGDGSLQAWIISIARHKVEDYFRRRFREADPAEEDHEPDPSALAPQFESVLDEEAMRAKVWRVLQELPERYRLALIWRYWDKTSARDMAMRTGKTEKAVERLLARARSQFRERWNGA